MFSLLKKDYETININDIDPIINNIDLIDIRETYEYKNGHIKTSKNIPMGDLLQNPSKYLNKDKKYYIMCQSGMRSKNTSNKLYKAGFNIVNLSGGFSSYMGINKK